MSELNPFAKTIQSLKDVLESDETTRGVFEINVQPVASGVLLYGAAFLVGLGTAVGSGCTSGHGICGLSRLSLRSLAAVCTFMVTAMITVFVLRHVMI